jgi:hypothetical protein
MFGLSFLYPLFLVAAAAVAIPIILHLLRRKTETVVDFPAVRLLDKTPVERHRRRRLRELILLVLRVTALLLLALAFARPYLDSSAGAIPAPTTVIAVDTSLSLSAPGQFDLARQAARRAVDAVPATHTVALVAFADAAELVVPATTDRGAVSAAVDRLAPTAGGTRFRTALARAAEAIPSGQGRIVVISDLQQAGWEAGDEGAVPDGIEIEVAEIAPPTGNLAVTTARRDAQAVVAAVHNFASRPVKAPVTLVVEGKAVAKETVDLPAQAAGDVRFTVTLPSRGAAEVRVEDAAGYQPDNARYLLLDPPGAVPIAVITSEPPGSSNAGLYVERALSVAGDGRAFTVNVVDGPAWSALPTAPEAQPGAVIVLGTGTLDRAGRDRIAGYLRGGGRILVALGPDVDLATLADTVGTAVVVDPDVAETGERTVTLVAVDGRHPIFRPFLSPTGALGDVAVERYRRLREQPGRTVLARFSGAGDAMTEQAVDRGRLLLFASDLDNRWNRFPLNPAFVPWAIETARYLSQGRQQQSSYTLPDVPMGVQPTPGVQTVALESREGPGQERRVAVNADIRESNPARTTADEFKAAITRLNQATAGRAHVLAREQEERQRLWQIGLLVMFVALAAEGFLGRRAL